MIDIEIENMSIYVKPVLVGPIRQRLQQKQLFKERLHDRWHNPY